MGKRTTFAPKHKIFNHKRYTLYLRRPKTKKDAESLAKHLRADQVVMGVRFINDARVAQFGDEWRVYTWQNRYYSETKRRIVMRQ